MWNMNCIGLVLILTAPYFSEAHASQDVAVGVNLINPYAFSTDQQNNMLEQIRAACATVIRASITLDEKGIDFAARAWERGIKIEWLIYRFGGYEPFGKTPLSAANATQFGTVFKSVLDRLESKGIILAGLELGNEINLSGTNPEFGPPNGVARQLSLADLASDAEGRRVAAGYLRYLEVLNVLKNIRDRSTLNRATPILAAGLGSYDQEDGPLPKWAKGDVVGIDTTLRFMRMHGLDDLVDAYAVHIYPDTRHLATDAAAVRKHRIDQYDLSACRPKGSSEGKPCWITEWGLDNDQTGCPIDDAARARLVREVMGDFRPYVQMGSVAGLLYFAWNSAPTPNPPIASSLWRCDGLTDAGRLAIRPDLLN